jgi:hypothetical protein
VVVEVVAYHFEQEVVVVACRAVVAEPVVEQPVAVDH